MAFIIRMAEEKDLEDIYKLSKSVNLFNLPAKKTILKELILSSIKSVANPKLPKFELKYLFVLEDVTNKKVIGTSQVKAQKTHDKRANYTFKILHEKKYSHSLDILVDHTKLKLREDWEPLTELRGLALEKSYQGSPYKLGKLLSFSRLFYISQFSKYFNEKLYVEIAPKSHAMWESLSSKFIPLTYKEADFKSKKDQEFFSSLLPKEDIYLSLLSKEAQEDIAQAPLKSMPAMKLLERISFIYKDEVDPFDGGACLRSRIQDLPFHENIVTAQIYNIDDADSSAEAMDKYFLLSAGEAADFRCALVQPLKVFYSDSEVKIYCEEKILKALKISSGKSVKSFVLQ